MMIDFNQYFEDSYQFTLKEIRYDLIESTPFENEIEVKVYDKVELKTEEGLFDINFYRDVMFVPEALYRLRVAYNIRLKLKNNIDASRVDIDWNKELANNQNPYIQNVASRASNLISDITSSYGNAPLITPPTLINNS